MSFLYARHCVICCKRHDLQLTDPASAMKIKQELHVELQSSKLLIIAVNRGIIPNLEEWESPILRVGIPGVRNNCAFAYTFKPLLAAVLDVL